MIKPSIGRQVLVYRGAAHIGGQWNCASVCAVNSDTNINVAGFDRDGHSFIEISLHLDQSDIASDSIDLPAGLTSHAPFACWMPYQRAVAK